MIERFWLPRDLDYQPPPNNKIWSCYSNEREAANSMAILERMIPAYRDLIRSCGIEITESAYVDQETSIVLEYTSARDVSCKAPILREFHFPNPDGRFPKVTTIVRCDDRRDQWENVPIDLPRGQTVNARLVSVELADYLFQELPLLTKVYRMLQRDLGGKYGNIGL